MKGSGTGNDQHRCRKGCLDSKIGIAVPLCIPVCQRTCVKNGSAVCPAQCGPDRTKQSELPQSSVRNCRTEVVMLTHYFIKPSTIDRIRASWLATHIERYVERLHTRGYAARSVYRRVPVLCAFAEFARAHGARDPADAQACIEAFVASRVARHGGTWNSARARAGYECAIRRPVRQLLQLALEADFQFAGGRAKRPFPFRPQPRDSSPTRRTSAGCAPPRSRTTRIGCAASRTISPSGTGPRCNSWTVRRSRRSCKPRRPA